MGLLDEANKAVAALRGLGARRLAILFGVGLAAFVTIGVAAFLLSRPRQEVVYSGLDALDVGRVSVALREANIDVDVSADGGSVLVELGKAARARTILAERGLPRGATAGYELFDKLGSLGLTSFMQDITRVRALEGELARTIQGMQGVRAARVHLVLPDPGSFRRTRQTGSASVVVRLASANDSATAQAIRRLVASATPGLAIESVTVLGTDGATLAAGGENEAQPARNSLERLVSEQLEENVRRSLAPIVGPARFTVSVVARINADKKQIQETIFNPDSRVERSVRVTKETSSSSSAAQSPVSVERNIPGDKAKGAGGGGGEESQKREEVTNYEVSSKSIVTTSAGHSVERLSVGILIDRAALGGKGGDGAQKDIDARLAEIRDLAASAVGLTQERGDTIKIVASEFADAARLDEGSQSPGVAATLAREAGAFVNALALLGVAALVVWFGLRPLAQSLANQPTQEGGLPALPVADGMAEPGFAADGLLEASPGHDVVHTESARRTAQRRLEAIVQMDEETATGVLRQWVRKEARG